MLEIQDLHLVLFSHNFMILLQTKKKLVNPNLHHMQSFEKEKLELSWQMEAVINTPFATSSI